MAAKDCPGAIKYKSHDEYWTSDAGVCNKSKSKFFSIADTNGSQKGVRYREVSTTKE